MGKKQNEEKSVFRTGYGFALLLLILLGTALIAIGEGMFPQGSFFNSFLVGCGITMAPSAIVAALFRFFLFREVKYELTQPIINEIKDELSPKILNQVSLMTEEYRNEIELLHALKEAGAVHPFRNRAMALKYFASAIDAETREIMVIGSSLKGLVQLERYKDIADKLKFKINKSGVEVRFLLTHPIVADLRASQEARQLKDIGKEIIETLRVIKDWGVKPSDVRLYKGTPTCFAIKTNTKMFLNPYPYIAVAYDSPCLVVETDDKSPSYFYGAFDRAHFNAWDTNVAERIIDFDATINELEGNLDGYANLSSKISDLQCK